MHREKGRWIFLKDILKPKEASVVRPTLLYFWLACHAALNAASSIYFFGFLPPQE
jgi:hypothetical protein